MSNKVLFLQEDYGGLKQGMPLVHLDGDNYGLVNTDVVYATLPSHLLHKDHPLDDPKSGYLYIDNVTVELKDTLVNGQHSFKVKTDTWPLCVLVTYITTNLTKEGKKDIISDLSRLPTTLGIIGDLRKLKSDLRKELNKF